MGKDPNCMLPKNEDGRKFLVRKDFWTEQRFIFPEFYDEHEEGRGRLRRQSPKRDPADTNFRQGKHLPREFRPGQANLLQGTAPQGSRDETCLNLVRNIFENGFKAFGMR